MGLSHDRRKPTAKLVVIVGLLFAVGCALAVSVYLADRKARVSAMDTLCDELGGHFFIELGDENYVIDFSDTGITNEDLKKVMRAAAKLPRPWIESGDFWLTLSGTKVDDSGLQFLSPRVTYLDVHELKISSKGAGTIADRAPRLMMLYLSKTDIDDEALAAIARHPPRLLLDVSHTSITAEGLRPLSGAMCEVIVEGTGISRDEVNALGIQVDLSFESPHTPRNVQSRP